MRGLRYWMCLGVVLPFMAQAKLQYKVGFDKANHTMEVELTADELDGDSTAFDMAVWAPGYYLILDYPKNLSDFKVTDLEGHALAWDKQGKSRWMVHTVGQKAIRLSYRIYANAQSVAESMVEAERAFVAPNGVFMYRSSCKNEPIEVQFVGIGQDKTPYAKVTTGLRQGHEPMSFVADGIDQLYDSPLLFGQHETFSFEVDGHHYDVGVETPDGLDRVRFVNDLKKIIQAATASMGGVVPYDNYAFLFLKKGYGGLEHCNSQADFTNGDFHFNTQEYYNFMGFVTHEYYHLYNVKYIRPIELGPFDYSKEVFTPSLWISEGFTVFYETALMHRAGIIDGNWILKEMSQYIAAVEGHEGHRHMSLRQSSYDIWLNFFNRNGNRNDVTISYYEKGPIIGFLMDIEIRRLTKNRKSLDDVMQALYRLCTVAPHPGEATRGFTEEEFWKICKDVAGAPLTQLRRYVDTTDDIDYEAILAHAGIEMNGSYELSPMRQCDRLAMDIRKSMLEF